MSTPAPEVVVLPLPQGTAIAEFSPTAVALNEMAAKLAGHTFDCTTTAGDKEARASRMALVQLRSTLEAKRKELKAPHLQAGQKIDAEAARIEAAILEMEGKIDRVIKAEETRKAQVKAEAEQRERARLKAQDAQLMALTLKPTTLISANAAQLQEALVNVQNESLEGFDDDYADRAKNARQQVIGTLVGMLEAATAREHEAEKMAAERLENQRIADEAAARRAEEDRARQEQREREDAAARVERDRLAEENRKRIAADEAAAAEKRAAEEQALSAERERLAAQRREQEAEAARQREQKERDQAEQARRLREQAEAVQAQHIANATLVDAARDAVKLLQDLDAADHLITRTLAAAILRHPVQ